MSYQQLIQQVKKGQFQPIYFLAGEETFFIDQVEKAILQNAFPAGGEEFNLDVVYGRDISSVAEVISTCQQYPSFAERRVVVVREAQHINKKDSWTPLLTYLGQLMPTTVLIVLYKNRKLDKRWEVSKKLIASKYYHEYAKLSERDLAPWIKSQVEAFGFQIDFKSAEIIADNLGNDLSRIVNELEKLTLVLQKGDVVDAIAIEKYIGISREYNTFELSSAVENRDVVKAVKIIDYFSKNPKSGPFPLVIGTLYSFFSKLWLFYNLSPADRANDSQLNKALGGYYRVQGVKRASRIYPPHKAEEAIALLAEYDLKSKGVGSKNQSESELMLELIYKLMN